MNSTVNGVISPPLVERVAKTLLALIGQHCGALGNLLLCTGRRPSRTLSFRLLALATRIGLAQPPSWRMTTRGANPKNAEHSLQTPPHDAISMDHRMTTPMCGR